MQQAIGELADRFHHHLQSTIETTFSRQIPMQTAQGLYYTDSQGGSNRDPIVLIHGIGGSHLVWPAAMRHVKGIRVLAIDLPGHGRSEGCAFRSVKQYVASLDFVLKSAGIFRAIFVGYSLGGQIAMQYCLDRPDQCAGLGMIASAAEPSVPSSLIDLLNDPGASGEVNRLTCEMVFSPERSPSQVFELERLLFTSRRSTLVSDWRAFISFSPPNIAKMLPSIPLWICEAQQDRLILPLKTRLLASGKSDVQRDVIEDCGHGIMVEQPQRVSTAFLSWLMAK